MTDRFINLASNASKAGKLACDAGRSLEERQALLAVCIECWEAAASEAYCDDVRRCCNARAAKASRARQSMTSKVEAREIA
jgi:hypothetical protein